MMDPTVICKKTRRLKARLLEICKNEPTVLFEISRGIDMGTKECQYQFRNRRWNCTLLKKSMKKVLQRDSKETSFVNAVISAGVTYTLTKACTKGSLLNCECGKINQGKNLKPDNSNLPWKWEGCSDNLQYGLRKAKTFMNVGSLEMGDLKSLTMHHNLEAGRLVIGKSMQTECKCHGFSGSCTLRTCWRSLGPFRNVGNTLKKRFRSSIRVVPSNDGHSFVPISKTVKPPDKMDLVYSEISPNFCTENKTTGSLGTYGRECTMNSSATESCSHMCCGRGYKTDENIEYVRCNCSFKFCCDVVCDTCAKKTFIHHCL
ncbi:hypothetical protein M8J75_011297 [Diaphorina citri]|nr:hypothetical protein M8J75_011297 [Diaphorina citri]